MTRSEETNLQAEIMIALSAHGCIVWRNNVGAYQDKSGAWIRYGVGGKGGSDLIGVTTSGALLAIEVKTPTGKPSPEQSHFIKTVLDKGGKAGIARSVEDALEICRS